MIHLSASRHAALALLVGLAPVPAAAVDLPHTFTPGTVASAAEVNENFAALASAITALETRVAPSTPQEIAGTYSYFELAIDVDNISLTQKSIAGAATAGTVTLSADGTGHANLSGQYRQLGFAEVQEAGEDDTVEVDFGSESEMVDDGFAWSHSNGVVTVVGEGNFVVAGPLLIQSVVNEEGKNGIVILAKQ